MNQEKAIRCISTKPGDAKVRFILAHLANDPAFMREIGFIKQELDIPEIYIDKEGNEALNLGYLETVNDSIIKEFEAKELIELQPTQITKPKKAKK